MHKTTQWLHSGIQVKCFRYFLIPLYVHLIIPQYGFGFHFHFLFLSFSRFDHLGSLAGVCWVAPETKSRFGVGILTHRNNISIGL